MKKMGWQEVKAPADKGHERKNSRMRRKTSLMTILILAIGAVLAGCAGIPTREEKRAREDLRTTETVYRPENSKPPLPTLTENSSLSDLIQYGLLNNPRVEAAFYEWKASVEAITVARSLPDPMLNLSAEIMDGVVEALTPGLMTDPMANWPVPSKLGLRADAAYGETLMKRAAFENELLTAALQVKRAYYQLWVVDEQIRWTHEILTVVDDMERLARERLAVGKVMQQDVLRAQIERDRLRTQLANLEDSRTTIVARMRSALGTGPDQPLPAFALSLEPTPPDFTEQSLMEIAFERNPRLKEMKGQVLQAVALYHLAQKSKVPDFAFGLEANVKVSPVPFMPFFGITLPIWRDKIAAEIASGSAEVGSAEAKLSAEELELAVMFAETAFGWREADRNVNLYGDRLIPKAKASLESARAGYSSGVSSFLDVLDTERMLLEYYMNHAMAVGEREIMLAEMSLVILGRWPQGVEELLSPQQSSDFEYEQRQPIRPTKGKR
ncbi:MAG: TolC family protein [Candidatus Abyssobacteria bacterium SURF_17]|uniref:TolC family protein n=1 Tax=Candidatus Abyssobacteria bacterium SURF_17 TaxID=2093361 RepID=A0A419EP29_9BACT|nr:MAG: TolC family protein [Candidatus Abyssubacteria bacterium SURF_17]